MLLVNAFNVTRTGHFTFEGIRSRTLRKYAMAADWQQVGGISLHLEFLIFCHGDIDEKQVNSKEENV